MLTANLPPLPASPAAPRQSHDWADIDNSDLVAKVRGSAGFRIMREIQPWDGALDAPPALHANKVFEFFYVQRKEGDMWKTLAKECFPEKYEEASNDKAEKKRLQSLWAQAVLDEIPRELGVTTSVACRARGRRDGRQLRGRSRGTVL